MNDVRLTRLPNLTPQQRVSEVASMAEMAAQAQLTTFVTAVREVVREELAAQLQGKAAATVGPLLMTKVEAADHLRVSPSLVNQLISRRELPVVRVGRTVRLRRVDVEVYAQQHIERSLL